MARQATSFGNADTWAFGPGSNGGTNGSRRGGGAKVVSNGQATTADARDYEQPAMFLSAVDEAPASERHVWDQLPEERGRRSRRYVGKHRA